MPLIVSLQQVGTNEYRAVIPAGAPFDVVVPIDGTGGTTMVTIPKGSVNSASLTVVSSESVSIGTLPILPRNHFGYVVSKSTVCNRTFQVVEGIAAAVPGVTDCRNISEIQLAMITRLDLNNKRITSLSGDDFDGMLSLTSLDLRNNQLSRLPDGIFEGLTTLTTLHLDGNTVDPLPISVSIDRIGENQFKAVVPAGAPFTIILPINAANGEVSTGTNSVTIPQGSSESSIFNITRTAGTKAAITLDIGTILLLPTTHTGYALSKSSTFPIEVFSRINSAPMFTDGDSTTHTIAENTASGENIGEPVAATDADNDTLTYTLSGTDASSFSLVSTSGQLQTKAALDYETKMSYSVVLSVSYGNGGSDSISITINITDIDEKMMTTENIVDTDTMTKTDDDTTLTDTTPTNNAPEFADGDTTIRSIAENTGAGVNIGSAVSATDADGDTLTYSLSGTDASSFSIDSTSGQLRTSASLDYETKASYSVIVAVSDDNGGSDSISVTINITDIDESTINIDEGTTNTAPVFTDGDSTTRSVAENTSAGVNIGSAVSATDTDGDTLAYSLSGTDASSFSIDSTNGQLRTSTSLDYETKVSYSVIVTVSDDNGGSDSISVTINITDIDEGTTNKDEGTTNKDEGTTNTAPIFTDGDNTNRSVAENTDTGVNIGSAVSASNADDDTLIYILSGTDASSFSIDSTNGQLRTNVSLDYETKASYSVIVAVFDGNGGSDSITVTINITNVNEAPIFSDGASTTREVAENTGSGVDIGTAISATDPENDDLTYSLGGTDVDSFSINGANGQLSTKSALNFETKNTYSVIVTVSDQLLTDRIHVTINITDVDEGENSAPVFDDGETSTREIKENTLSGQDIGNPVGATDSDSGDTLSYTLSGTDASSFSIDSTSGQLRTSASLDYETKTSYSVIVTVSDDNGGSNSISVTINITNVNEAPIFSDGASTTREIAEHTGPGVDIGTAISATDPENDDLTYSLSGTDAGSFNITRTNGQLRTETTLDFETKKTYSVIVTVTDQLLTDRIHVTINITDEQENMAPVFIEGTSATREISENTLSGQNVGNPVGATDVNSRDTLTYTLSGPDASSFDIISTSGQLKTSAGLDYETKSSYSVMITVSDGNGGSDSITVTINVTDIVETYPLFGRTQQVIVAIVESISGVEHPANVTNVHLAAIVELDVSLKSISQLNAGDFNGLTSLTELDLSDNSLTSLPSGIFAQLTSLERLTLSSNGLTSLPSGIFAQLTSLERLNLTGNDLTTLPSGIFAQLTALEHLFLSNNRLTSLPSGIFDQLTSLELLTLSGNDLTTLSSNIFAQLTALEILSIQNNDLRTLPAFDNLTSLRTLRVSGNPISDYGPLNSLTDVSIDINLNNNIPTFTDGDSTTRSVAENTPTLQNIGNPVAATDADSSDRLSYSLGGTDMRSFYIVSTTGQIQTLDALDYETKTSYSVTVTVYDGNSGGDRITVTINVTDVAGAAPSIEMPSASPNTTTLLSNFPNPFNPETWIPYQLSKPSDVRITIYDIRGTVVRKLQLGHQKAGYYLSQSRAAHWDGRNRLGERVANGIYYYQLQADRVSPLRKMVILK